MTLIDLNLEDALLELDSSVKDYTERNSWTGIHTAYLGDGITPPTVVVPVAERIAPGALYCHRFNRDNKEVFQVLNTYAGITFDNENTGMPVKVGYPEGEAVLQIKSMAGEALAFTGGAQPLQTQVAELTSMTYDRLQELRIIPGTGMTPDLTGGKWRSGNIIVTWTKAATVDLTSSIPATGGNALWLLLSMTEAGGFTITLGDEFVASSQGETSDRVPLAVPSDELQLAWIQLTNGQTTIAISDIINLQGIPTITSSSGDIAENLTTDGADLTTNGLNLTTV